MQQSAQPLIGAIARRASSWPGPLAFLSRQSGFRQLLLVVLLVSLPLWLYAITSAGLTLMVVQEPGTQHLASFIIGRVMLYPLFFGTYLLALRVTRSVGMLRFWVLQALITAAFLSLMYPLLLMLNAWTFDLLAPMQPNLLSELLHGDFNGALAPFRLWRLWLSTSLELSEIYLLGLALILALDSFLRYRAEQSLTAELHAKWLEAQLATLRDQIGPHFLFNALNTILASIRDEPLLAERMTVELGALLRHNLDRGDKEFTTVADEVQFMERYLATIKMRFEDRLSVSVDVDPQIAGYSIPAFLFLPLVENAVKHGVSRVPGRNDIEIRGRRLDDKLVFSFMNTAGGADMPRRDTAHKAIGLENTRARIQALYGEEGSFSAGFDGSSQWTATVTIPAR
jgi:sensor histidine kinase YesM